MLYFRTLKITLIMLLFSSLLANANIQLKCENHSFSANSSETVEYPFILVNNTTEQQVYHLKIDKPRELACDYLLSDTLIRLAANEEHKCTLSVTISNRIPVGGQETAYLSVSTDIHSYKEKFISVRSRPHPFMFATEDLLNEAKEKVEQHAWAKANLSELKEFANNYKVPNRSISQMDNGPRDWFHFNYKAGVTKDLFKITIAWKVTGDSTYLNKILPFVRGICDPEEGYLTTGHATTGFQVHEGQFFIFLAAMCDILESENMFTEEDTENIEITLRHYLKGAGHDMNSIGIMNHQASANAAAVLVSLYLEDMVMLDHFMTSEGGFVDQFSKGVMADGWWFEGTVGYCYLVTHQFTIIAQAFENYGLDLYNQRFPMKYKSKDFENAKEGFTGMAFDIWGPTGKSTRGYHEMFVGYIPMMDEEARVVANNDANLAEPSPFYEMAYRHNRIDDLAWVISKTKRDTWEALLYGVAELPEVADPRSKSAYVSNVGIVALRSQAKDPIQAYFKWGTHGGWHGHFDRTGMIALDRYGHQYFGTEMAWFGYHHAGYKECIQTTATHNIVMVNEMQQEAVPSEQVLFHQGEMMQASVLETNARWRPIPLNNPEIFPPWNDSEFVGDAVLQRRLSVVTDDYVIIADYVKANEESTFDCLIHPVGFKSIEGAKTNGNVLPLVNESKSSPYKYFTNGQWYTTKKGAIAHFEDDEANVALDIHTLWPKKADILLAKYPNGGKRNKSIRNDSRRATYAVRTHAKEQVFIHLLEPRKGESKIESVNVNDSNEITVMLTNGVIQTIQLSNLDGESSDLKVTLTNSKDGKDIGKEIAQP